MRDREILFMNLIRLGSETLFFSVQALNPTCSETLSFRIYAAIGWTPASATNSITVLPIEFVTQNLLPIFQTSARKSFSFRI